MADVLSEFMNSPLFAIIIVSAIVGFIGYILISKFISGRAKIIRRSDVQKKELIKNMSLNKTDLFKTLWHGNQFLGKIISYKNVTPNPIDKDIIKAQQDLNEKITKARFAKTEDDLQKAMIDMDRSRDELEKLMGDNIVYVIFAPKWFSNVSNPFRKEPMIIRDKYLVKEYSTKKLIVPPDFFMDRFMGIFFDMGAPEQHLSIIKEEMFRTDLDTMASVYYVKGQEQAIINPENAIQMALKEKELQIELAKKRGQQSTI